MKQKRKLRIFISNTAFPAKDDAAAAAASNPPNGVPGDAGAAAPATPEGSATTCWELRVEGRLIDEDKKVFGHFSFLNSVNILQINIRSALRITYW
jgi:hypothetical protein